MGKILRILVPIKKVILGLASVMFIAAICTEARAFVVEQSNNKYQHWLQSDMPISYKIYRGPTDELPLEWIPAIISSFDTWASVNSATVTFQYVGTTSVNTVEQDGQNVIIWVTEDANWSHGSNVAAYTTTHVDLTTGRIVEFDMEINATPSRTATKPWSATGEQGKMDLQNMVTHEAGHAIGLDHVSDTEATMYPYMNLGESKKRDLETDDVNGVSFIYPTEAVVFEMVSGNDQTGTPGTPLPAPLIVKVANVDGIPLEGKFVIFDIINGAGILVPTVPITTDHRGLADATLTPDSEDKVVVRAAAPGLEEQAFWVNNNAPILSWTGEVNYENDGLDPEVGYGSTNFIFKINYSDADNDPPSVRRIWIDMDGDDLFETDEKFNMLLGTSPPYSSGVTYLAFPKIPYSAGSSNVKYYFEFRDRDDLPPASGITSAISPATAIDAPDVLQTPGNSAPVVSDIPDQSIAEDGSFASITLDDYVSDVDNANSEITWTYSGNSELTVSIDANRVATVTMPNENWNGSETITFRATDTGGLFAEDSATFEATAVNDAPTMSDITDQPTDEDTPTGAISFTVGDVETAAADLAVTGSSDNQALIPDANIAFGGSGANRTVTLSPAANETGTATITLTVDDGTDTTTDSFTLTVTAVNDAPTILGTIPDQIKDEDAAAWTLNLSGFESDVEDSTTALDWTLSGVDTALFTAVITDSDNDILTFTSVANAYGSDTITLTLTDSGGLTASQDISVTLNPHNDAPVAADDTASTSEDVAVTIDVLANDSDVDVDALTVSAVTQGSDGTVVNSATDVTYTPNADFNGTDSFTYAASDGKGGTDTAIVTITVTPVNDAPVANDQSVSTDEDTAVAITLTGSDVEGDSLTFAVATGPSNGTLSGTPPSLTYTPNADYNGLDSFTFKVNDGTQDSAPATITVTVPALNDAPVAEDDVASMYEGEAMTINVIGNDTDVDGTIDPSTVTIGTGPSNGSVVENVDGTVTYTPTAGFIGTDTFTYTVQDDDGATSNEGVVTVTVKEIVERLDLDLKIKELKDGTASEEEVKTMIEQYMERP